MRTVIVTQSNYIPWRGWFAMVARGDALVLLDSVQYTRRDWRNRNRIRTPQGLTWLTIPVEAKGRFHQAVDETRITDRDWVAEHLRAIDFAYRRAPHHADIFPWLERTLLPLAAEPLLSHVNEALIRAICARLAITVPILRDSALIPRAALQAMDPSERLAALSEAAGATRYLTGPAARAYMDSTPFERRGIDIAWMDYAGLPDYPQLWGGFEPAVSVVDLLLNAGPAAAALVRRGVPA